MHCRSDVMRDPVVNLNGLQTDLPNFRGWIHQWREGGRLDSAGLRRSTGCAARIPRSGSANPGYAGANALRSHIQRQIPPLLSRHQLAESPHSDLRLDCPNQFQSMGPASGRDEVRSSASLVEGVSIHSPSAGRDKLVEYLLPKSILQSTHPPRGATRLGVVWRRGKQVSIHAPRRGCDPSSIAH